jgi:YebC/PmpR family DNA-binding regulatory protein
MAGHSKWANIQHRKNAQDAKRGKLFTKLIREITVASRMSGGDPTSNPRLRTAIDKALTANMTRDTIDRAIKRGAGGDEGANMEEVRYEGYGPGGVAIIVDCLTDNRNRTVGEVRHAFTKNGGNLGTDGSVAYLFSQKGVFTFAPDSDENKIMEIALDAGAEDVSTNEDGSIDVLTSADDFNSVKEKLSAQHLDPVQAEDIDDVQNVYSNAQ